MSKLASLDTVTVPAGLVRTRVEIARGTQRYPATALVDPALPGLAITSGVESHHGYYVLTHTESGHKLPVRCKTLDRIASALRDLATAGIDWTQSKAQLYTPSVEVTTTRILNRWDER